MIRYLKTLVAVLVASVMAVGELRNAQAQEYGGFALGTTYGGDTSARAWAFDFGDSAAEAEDAAGRRCGDLLGSSCRTWWASFTNSCYAVAVSECLEGCMRPAYGVAGGSSRNEASTAAIAVCESEASKWGGRGGGGGGGGGDLSRGDERPGRTGRGLRRRRCGRDRRNGGFAGGFVGGMACCCGA